MQNVFVSNGAVIGVSKFDPAAGKCQPMPGVIDYQASDSNEVHIGYVLSMDSSGAPILDTDGLPTFVTPAATVRYSIPTVPQFWLLFHSAERIAMRAAAAGGDALLADLLMILDDPRLTGVDLNLVSNQNGIEYALSVVGPRMVPAYTVADISARLSEILIGQIK